MAVEAGRRALGRGRSRRRSPSAAVVRDDLADLRREDERDHRPRRAPPRRRRARRRRRPACGALAPRLRSALRSTDPAVLVAGRRHPHRPRRLARRGDRRRRRRCGARRRRLARPRSSPSTSAVRRRPASSSTAGAAPGDLRTKAWEDRFGEQRYAELGGGGLDGRAEGRRRSSSTRSSTVAIVGPHGSGRRRRSPSSSAPPASTSIDASADNGRLHRRRAPGAAADRRCSSRPQPGQVVALVAMADGADVFLFRVTDAIAAHGGRRHGPSPTQLTDGDDTLLVLEVPRLARRAAGPAAQPPRAGPHVGLRGRAPPGLEVRVRRLQGPRVRRVAPAAGPGRVRQRQHRRHGAGADGRRRPRPSPPSPSTSSPTRRRPPIVFAVADFDGGGRLPVELTDVHADGRLDRHEGRDDLPPDQHLGRASPTTSGRPAR